MRRTSPSPSLPRGHRTVRRSRSTPPDDPFGPPSVQVEAVAPPVVVAMVAHDPGPWFEDALRSIAAQTYRNTSLLVDRRRQRRGSRAPRRRRSLPDAHVRRLDADVGFGPAANEVLEAVEGADFYLFCHDDVRLEPDAIQVMVEEAFRSNAGIVGAKLVDWDDPEQLLQVGHGRGQDRRTGAVRRAGRARPGAARRGPRRLLRPRRGDARAGRPVLGARRVRPRDRAAGRGPRPVVAGPRRRRPRAGGAGGRGSPTSRRSATADPSTTGAASRCATASAPAGSATRRRRRVRVLPQAAAIALVEFVYGVVTGRFRHAGDVLSAWTWNLRHRRQHAPAAPRAGRAPTGARPRRPPPPGARQRPLVGLRARPAGRRPEPAGHRHRVRAGDGHEPALGPGAARRSSPGVPCWSCCCCGSRDLFTNGVPTVGQLAAVPEPSRRSWCSSGSSGFRSTGLGSDTAGPDPARRARRARVPLLRRHGAAAHGAHHRRAAARRGRASGASPARSVRGGPASPRWSSTSASRSASTRSPAGAGTASSSTGSCPGSSTSWPGHPVWRPFGSVGRRRRTRAWSSGP